MPCWPGFRPVAKVAQATGDSAGLVVASGLQPPVCASRARWGSSPAASQPPSSTGSIPSAPRTTTRPFGTLGSIPQRRKDKDLAGRG